MCDDMLVLDGLSPSPARGRSTCAATRRSGSASARRSASGGSRERWRPPARPVPPGVRLRGWLPRWGERAELDGRSRRPSGSPASSPIAACGFRPRIPSRSSSSPCPPGSFADPTAGTPWRRRRPAPRRRGLIPARARSLGLQQREGAGIRLRRAPLRSEPLEVDEVGIDASPSTPRRVRDSALPNTSSKRAFVGRARDSGGRTSPKRNRMAALRSSNRSRRGRRPRAAPNAGWQSGCTTSTSESAPRRARLAVPTRGSAVPPTRRSGAPTARAGRRVPRGSRARPARRRDAARTRARGSRRRIWTRRAARGARTRARRSASRGSGRACRSRTARCRPHDDLPRSSSPPTPVRSEPPLRPRRAERGSARCTARAARAAGAHGSPPGRRSPARPVPRCEPSRRARGGRRPALATRARPSRALGEPVRGRDRKGQPLAACEVGGDGEHGGRVAAAGEAETDTATEPARAGSRARARRAASRPARYPGQRPGSCRDEPGGDLERREPHRGGDREGLAGTRRAPRPGRLRLPPTRGRRTRRSSRRTPITISRGRSWAAYHRWRTTARSRQVSRLRRSVARRRRALRSPGAVRRRAQGRGLDALEPEAAPRLAERLRGPQRPRRFRWSRRPASRFLGEEPLPVEVGEEGVDIGPGPSASMPKPSERPVRELVAVVPPSSASQRSAPVLFALRYVQASRSTATTSPRSRATEVAPSASGEPPFTSPSSPAGPPCARARGRGRTSVRTRRRSRARSGGAARQLSPSFGRASSASEPSPEGLRRPAAGCVQSGASHSAGCISSTVRSRAVRRCRAHVEREGRAAVPRRASAAALRRAPDLLHVPPRAPSVRGAAPRRGQRGDVDELD